jgi:hypothetical protein
MFNRFFSIRNLAALLTAKFSTKRNRPRVNLTVYKARRSQHHYCCGGATWLSRVFLVNAAWVPTSRSRPDYYCFTITGVKVETKGGEGKSRGVTTIRVWYFNKWLGTTSLYCCDRLNSNSFAPRLYYTVLKLPSLASLRSWGRSVILGCNNLHGWITRSPL